MSEITEFTVRVTGGFVTHVNGKPVSYGYLPFAFVDGEVGFDAARAQFFGVTPGQRVLPERPEGVPEDAVPTTVWISAPAPAAGVCHFYTTTGAPRGWMTPEGAATSYGVTFPDPEPTPESVILSALDKDPYDAIAVGIAKRDTETLLHKLDAAGFEIVRKPADKTGPNCVNCGRPLKVNDDGSLYRDYLGDVLHHDMDWGCLNGTSIVAVATPEGVR